MHSYQALVPSFNDAASADDALEGFAFAVGGIEFGAVVEPAGIVGGDERASHDGFAAAGDEVFDNQVSDGGHIGSSGAKVIVRVVRRLREGCEWQPIPGGGNRGRRVPWLQHWG